MVNDSNDLIDKNNIIDKVIDSKDNKNKSIEKEKVNENEKEKKEVVNIKNETKKQSAETQVKPNELIKISQRFIK